MLRDFAPGDQDAVRDLVLAGMRERWGSAFDPNANRDIDDIWVSYVKRGGEVVVVEDGGAAVATGTLLAEPDGSGRIVRVAVHPRRRRRGLARSVVADLVERARRRGLDRVVVTTDTPWASAVALYRSCGFDLIARTADITQLSMPLGGSSAATGSHRVASKPRRR